jgi:hypothetical protein
LCFIPFEEFPENKKLLHCIKDLPVTRNTENDRFLKMEINMAD